MVYPSPPPPADIEAVAWLSAVGVIRDYCGWHIAPEFEETVTLDGPGGPVLILPTRKVKAIASITNDGHLVSDPEWSSDGLVRGGWTGRFRGVVVTMTHGFSQWPAELESLVRDMLAAADRGGVKAVTSRSHQVAFESVMSEANISKLEKYRLRAEP